MSILYELRYPRRWHTKLFITVLALVLSAVLATAAIAGFLVYRIVKPQRTSSEISMESFPGRPDAVEFSVPGIGARHGWFFPGLRGAPTIVLCHGYGSSRGELLTLVSALQDHQYNAFVFDFAAHGGNAGITTFGYREADEVRAAITRWPHERTWMPTALACGDTTWARTPRCGKRRRIAGCARLCWIRPTTFPKRW